MAKSKLKLSTAEVAKLQQAQRDMGELLPELDNLEGCGVDCQNLRALHYEYSAQVAKMLDTYGPNRHTKI